MAVDFGLLVVIPLEIIHNVVDDDDEWSCVYRDSFGYGIGGDYFRSIWLGYP